MSGTEEGVVMFKVRSFGKEYDVTVNVNKYVDGGLALTMDYMDEDYHCMMPFATLTVNLGEKLAKNQAYVDTNNCPWAEGFIEKYGLGKETGRIGMSGFCFYPLYEFDMEAIGA